MSFPSPEEDGPPLSKQHVEAQIRKFEDFINQRLRVDLKAALDTREKVLELISKHLQLKEQLELIKSDNLTKMKTLVDIGSQFFMQAKIPDTSKVYIKVGLNYSVEMTIDEGLAFIEKKEKSLHKQAETQTQRISQIKAHIQLILDTMRQLQELEAEIKR
ncbi:hypothetical protein HDV00_004371 [Rhizophlyctis rosea]|nr:hypothetical protein HDV00_004371 [Rhizophlyctis rosea]